MDNPNAPAMGIALARTDVIFDQEIGWLCDRQGGSDFGSAHMLFCSPKCDRHDLLAERIGILSGRQRALA